MENKKKVFDLDDYNKELLVVKEKIEKENVESKTKIDAVKIMFDLLKKASKLEKLTKEEQVDCVDKALEIVGEKKWDLLLLLYSQLYFTKNILQFKIIIIDKIILANEKNKYYDLEEVNSAIRDINYESLNNFINEKIKYEKKDYVDRTKQDAFICIYLLLMIALEKNYYNKEFEEKFIIFQSVFFMHFAATKLSDRFNLGIVSKSMVKNRFSALFKSYTYLSKGIIEEVNKANRKNRELLDANNELLTKNNELNSEKVELKKNIEQLNVSLKESNKKVSELNEELTKTKKENSYNKNFYEQRYVESRNSLLSDIKNDLKLEIEGIQDIIEDASDSIKAKIENRISRINERLNRKE